MNDLEFAIDATIQGWLRALELKDANAEGRAVRVSELFVAFAREFGVSDEELIHLRRGALLHDIGKMGVPDLILNKPGPLSEPEWTLMKLHPELGYEVLVPIPFLRPAMDIVYCHHENWDGTGYPRGLSGGEIPLSARIFAVCNVWDALVTDQPYRKAWTKEEALSYIERGANTQFDPAIVAAFIKFITHAD